MNTVFTFTCKIMNQAAFALLPQGKDFLLRTNANDDHEDESNSWSLAALAYMSCMFVAYFHFKLIAGH